MFAAFAVGGGEDQSRKAKNCNNFAGERQRDDVGFATEGLCIGEEKSCGLEDESAIVGKCAKK